MAFAANGIAIPVAKRNAPIGGATSWFVRRKAPCIRALARPSSSRSTRPGRKVLLAESANVSAVPRMNSVTRTTTMLTEPVTMVATRTARASARPRSTAMTRRRRSKRSATVPPRTPKSRVGRYSLRTAIETRNGLLVCDATSSGPAASTMPSPTLLMSAAASSQRKLRPSRVGTMVSVVQASGERTRGRIQALRGAPDEREIAPDRLQVRMVGDDRVTQQPLRSAVVPTTLVLATLARRPCPGCSRRPQAPANRSEGGLLGRDDPAVEALGPFEVAAPAG